MLFATFKITSFSLLYCYNFQKKQNLILDWSLFFFYKYSKFIKIQIILFLINVTTMINIEYTYFSNKHLVYTCTNVPTYMIDNNDRYPRIHIHMYIFNNVIMN